jgi:hypothetical protein
MGGYWALRCGRGHILRARNRGEEASSNIIFLPRGGITRQKSRQDSFLGGFFVLMFNGLQTIVKINGKMACHKDGNMADCFHRQRVSFDKI